MEKKDVAVFLENREKGFAPVSIELLGKGRALADNLKSSLIAFAVGNGLRELDKLGGYGVDRVIYVESPELGFYRTLPYARAIVSMIQKTSPYIVLFGATTIGRDLAPRVASTLKVGLTADCTELEIGEYKIGKKKYTNMLLQIRPAWGGNIIATIVSPDSYPSMATVREGVMTPPTFIEGRQAVVDKIEIEFSSKELITTIVERVLSEQTHNLKDAKIIIGAGMGAANDRTMELIFKLAQVLKAEVGGSRPLVDAGFLERDRQIGQTGVTVRPNLYIACGISGQIQHLAGISGAKRIMAINTDPEAPIFKVAHYKLVGDVAEVIPLLIDGYKEVLSEIKSS